MSRTFFVLGAPGGAAFPGSDSFNSLLKLAGLAAQQLAAVRQSLGGEIDYVEMNGDFGGGYDQVTGSPKEEPTRGYVAVANNTMQYALQRDAGDDHPLFASVDGGFSSSMA